MAFSVAAIVVAAVGAAVSAYAAVKQGEQASANAKFNAKMAGREAEQRNQAAQAAAEDARRKNEALLAAQRARYGASGLIQEDGTPLAVMLQSEEEAALEVARIRHSGTQAIETGNLESKMYRRQAKQARQAGYLSAGSALLGGASKAMGAYGGGGSSSYASGSAWGTRSGGADG